MNFKKLKSQSGRSMVEMLGVLAIIGVLSVGGIAGYSLSMRRHRANTIIDLAAKYALVVYNNCQQEIMNGEATSVTNCSSHKITFDNAGVGTKPADIGFLISGFSTDTNTGVDTVLTTISMGDEKLCKAIASITGTSCNSTGTGITIKIKQN